MLSATLYTYNGKWACVSVGWDVQLYFRTHNVLSRAHARQRWPRARAARELRSPNSELRTSSSCVVGAHSGERGGAGCIARRTSPELAGTSGGAAPPAPPRPESCLSGLSMLYRLHQEATDLKYNAQLATADPPLSHSQVTI